MASAESGEIIGQITDSTVQLFNRNLDLAQRIAGMADPRQDGPPIEGRAQDVWTTWTESAGDLVQITYLTAQLVDSLWGRPRSSSPGD
jgi:hypothetical protein